MRIGIDARFYHKGSAGLGRYTQELINHVVAAAPQHTFVIFLRPEALPEFTLVAPNIEVRTTTIPHYSFREQIGLTRELNQADLDLMHFTNFNYPVRYRRPFVVTIHDLTLLRYAGRSKLSTLKVAPMRQVVTRAARDSQHIITISRFQRDLIIQELGATREKVSVIYEAVEARFKPLPPEDIVEFRNRNGLPKPFIMYTGQWRQHKNLVRLLKAFKHIRASHDVQLVLVGKIDPAFPIIPQTIREQGLEGDVVMTDFIEDADLPCYYNAADVFAFPSLSEGFGLPPLEAMTCGTPVAASSAAPMPEILGTAAAYFDPYSVSGIADSLGALLRNTSEQDRLRQLGFDQVKKYSWQKMATQTLAIYEQAVSHAPQ